jgi:hypothetical protein
MELGCEWSKNCICNLASRITAARPKRKSRYGSLDFQDRFDILLKMRLNGYVAVTLMK